MSEEAKGTTGRRGLRERVFPTEPKQRDYTDPQGRWQAFEDLVSDLGGIAAFLILSIPLDLIILIAIYLEVKD